MFYIWYKFCSFNRRGWVNWNIKGCSKNCINCDKAFSDEETYYCRLFLEPEGPCRKDYCQKCWSEFKNEILNREHSYWQGRFKVEPEPIEEKIEEPILKKLLKKWIDSQERLHQCFCYIIAVMLERNKTFRPKPAIKHQKGKKQLVYEDRDNGEVYVMEDPGLTLAELNEIEDELKNMLKKELEEN